MVTLPITLIAGVKIAISWNDSQVRRPVVLVDAVEDLLVARLAAERLHRADPGHRLDEVHDHECDRLAGPAVRARPTRCRNQRDSTSSSGNDSSVTRPSLTSSASSRIDDRPRVSRAVTRPSKPPSSSSSIASMSEVSRRDHPAGRVALVEADRRAAGSGRTPGGAGRAARPGRSGRTASGTAPCRRLQQRPRRARQPTTAMSCRGRRRRPGSAGCRRRCRAGPGRGPARRGGVLRPRQQHQQPTTAGAGGAGRRAARRLRPRRSRPVVGLDDVPSASSSATPRHDCSGGLAARCPASASSARSSAGSSSCLHLLARLRPRAVAGTPAPPPAAPSGYRLR